MKMLPTALFALTAFLFGSFSLAEAGPPKKIWTRLPPPPCYRYAFITVKVARVFQDYGGVSPKETWNVFTDDTCGGDRVKLTDDLKNTSYIVPLDAWGDENHESKIALLSADQETGNPSIGFNFLDENGGKAGDSLRVELDSSTSYPPFLPYGGLSFGPDGRMAFSAVLKKPDGGSALSIVSEAGELFSMDLPADVLPKNGITLDWSPTVDATRSFYGKIIFSKPEMDADGNTTAFTLQVLDVQTKEVLPLTEFAGGAAIEGQMPAVSVDDRMVFSRQQEGRNRILTCDLVSSEGSYHCESLKILELEGRQFSPSWSPDGRKIFFTSCTGPVRDVCYAFMANRDGSALVQLTNENESGLMPVCLPPRMDMPRKMVPSPALSEVLLTLSHQKKIESLTDPVDYERVTKLKQPEGLGGGSRGPGGPTITGSSGREDGAGESLPLPSSFGKQFDMSGKGDPGANLVRQLPSGYAHSSIGKENGELPSPGEKVGLQETEDKPASGSGTKTEDSTIYQANTPREPSNYTPNTQDSTATASMERVGAAFGAGTKIATPPSGAVGVKGLRDVPIEWWTGKKTPNPEAVEKGDMVLTPSAKKQIDKTLSGGIVVPAAPGGNPPAPEGTPNPEGNDKGDIDRMNIDPEAAVTEATENNPHGANVNPQ